MSPSAALPMADQRRFGAREIAWWAGAAALVLVAHAAIGYAMQSWRPAEPDGGPPQAQVIELSPMALTPAEPAPVSDEIAPDQPDPAEEPVAETEPPPEPPVEQAEPVTEPSEVAPADTVEPTPPTVAERVDQPPLKEVVPEIAEAVTTGSGHSAAASRNRSTYPSRPRPKKQAKTEVKVSRPKVKAEEACQRGQKASEKGKGRTAADDGQCRCDIRAKGGRHPEIGQGTRLRDLGVEFAGQVEFADACMREDGARHYPRALRRRPGARKGQSELGHSRSRMTGRDRPPGWPFPPATIPR